VTGGQEIASDGSYERPAPTEIIDPTSGSITTVGQMVHPRYGHTTTLLSDGRVLIAGGDVSIGPNPASNASAELFDPATGTFEETGSLNHARMYHRATLLEDGRVLITGGVEAGKNTAEAEVFDPATSTFTPTGTLHVGRTDHSATLLPDGRVLIVGGNGLDAAGFVSDTATAVTELFDPRTGTITETAPLITERSQHAAVLLPDGRVLIAGGFNFDGEPTTTELFDPATGTFQRGANTLDPLGQTSAAPLHGGRVLVVGETDALELFDASTSGRLRRHRLHDQTSPERSRRSIRRPSPALATPRRSCSTGACSSLAAPGIAGCRSLPPVSSTQRRSMTRAPAPGRRRGHSPRAA
jgi:Kelch motif